MPTCARGQVNVDVLTVADNASARGQVKRPPRTHPRMLGQRWGDYGAVQKPNLPFTTQPLPWWKVPPGNIKAALLSHRFGDGELERA